MTRVLNRVDELIAIKARNEGRGISRRMVAEETGLSLSSVQNWASNNLTRYDAYQIATFCDYFGCDVSELFVIVDDDQKKALLASA